MDIKPIAHIKNDFTTKFGVPRQSGLSDIRSRIVFTPQFRDINALKGIEEFSHLWLIWHFSLSEQKDGWSPTVRPPRLGGNKRVGVFASRSPFRPNPLGLSCVKLEGIENGKDGPVLIVSGADLVNDTPIFDIKPYLPFADAHPEAGEGYTKETKEHSLLVSISENLLKKIPKENHSALLEVLKGDPRPGYQDDPERIYGFVFGGYEIKFCVKDDTLTVTDIDKII